MSSSQFLRSNRIYLARQHRRTLLDIERDEAAIKLAGGEVTAGLAGATHIVVHVSAGVGPVWQCSARHSTPSRVKLQTMTLAEFMYAVFELPRPRPKLVTSEYLAAWLHLGREPDGVQGALWTVTLLGPDPSFPKSTPAFEVEPKPTPSDKAEPILARSPSFSDTRQQIQFKTKQ
ncbi:uncharacterized protein LOC62_07G009442 [Vanrija pseudolonga]|uniref:Uncharacterized protein n=1 Tax=Vanrija pseudolonga TaxID=143232 RepID=A0AAF0YG35_9TREE|nr:hypothetical protein LOC62_07G009442 [Vanrija pseudolonga]